MKYFFVLMLLLSAVSGVYAYQFSGSDATLQACELHQLKYTLVNNNAEVIKANLVMDGPDWITLVPNQVLLAPGESEVFTGFVQAPCGVSGDFRNTITIDAGDVQILEQTITIFNPNNIQATLGQASTCPCENAELPFTLSNTGTYKETYKISGKYVQDITVKLFPGETYAGPLLAASACDEYGIFDNQITIEAQKSGYKQVVESLFQVNACYDFTLIAPEQVEICGQINSLLPVFVQNTANIANTYKLESNADLTGNSFTLEPGQLGVTYLTLEPGTDIASITATSKLGNVQATQNINVTTNNCYNVSINLTSANTCQLPFQTPVEFSNLGTQNFTGNISIEGGRYLSIEQAINLEPSESEIKQLDVQAQELAPGTYNAKISLANELGVTYAKNIQFNITSNQQCFAVEISPDKLEPGWDYYDIDVRHVGTASAQYEALLEGPLTLGLNQTEFNLNPGDNTTLRIVSAQNVTDPTYAKIIFRTDGIAFEQQISWTSANFWWLWLILVLLILLLLILIILALRRPKRVKEEKKKKPKQVKPFVFPWWIVIILLLLLVGFLVLWWAYAEIKDDDCITCVTNVSEFVAPFNETGELEGFKVHIVEQGNTYTMDLDTYFFDQDNDSLTYNILRVDNISIDIQDNIATLTPEGDFLGARNFSIIASDAQDTTTSPELTLIVVPPKYTTAAEVIVWIILLGIILGLMAAVVLIYQKD